MRLFLLTAPHAYPEKWLREQQSKNCAMKSVLSAEKASIDLRHVKLFDMEGISAEPRSD